MKAALVCERSGGGAAGLALPVRTRRLILPLGWVFKGPISARRMSPLRGSAQNSTGRADVGGQERGGPLAIFFMEGPDAFADVIAEDVSAGKFGELGAAIDEAPGDGIAVEEIFLDAGVAVFVDGVDELGIGGGGFDAWAVVEGFAVAPTVVAALGDDIDFLPEVLSDLGIEEPAGGFVEGEAPGVAKAVGVDFGADFGGIDGFAKIGSDADERIVGGDFVSRFSIDDVHGGGKGDGILLVQIWFDISGLAVNIDAEDGGEEILVDEAGVVERVIGVAFIADGGVEIAVRAELDAAAVVVGGEVELGDVGKFGGHVGFRPLGIGLGDTETGDAVEADLSAVLGDDGVVGDIEVPVVFEIGMEGDAEESPFDLLAEGPAFLCEVGIDVHEEGFFWATVFAVEIGDHFDGAGFADDEEAVGFARGCDNAEGLDEVETGASVDGEGIDGGVSGRDRELWWKSERFGVLAGDCVRGRAAGGLGQEKGKSESAGEESGGGDESVALNQF